MTFFLNDDPTVTDSELRDVALNFIIAGRDTTAQLLSWFTYLVLQKENAAVLAKVYAEIDALFGADGTANLDYSTVNSCSYLECCFLETLRLRPSVPHLVRYAKVDIALPGKEGHIIRKGDRIFVPTYAMGRMAWLWKEPLVFRPERFADDKQKFSPAQYPAFNIPPRLCLGKHVALLEAKVAIVKLFSQYTLEEVPGQEVTYEFSVTNQRRNGFKGKMTPREKKEGKA